MFDPTAFSSATDPPRGVARDFGPIKETPTSTPFTSINPKYSWNVKRPKQKQNKTERRQVPGSGVLACSRAASRGLPTPVQSSGHRCWKQRVEQTCTPNAERGLPAYLLSRPRETGVGDMKLEWSFGRSHLRPTAMSPTVARRILGVSPAR